MAYTANTYMVGEGWLINLDGGETKIWKNQTKHLKNWGYAPA